MKLGEKIIEIRNKYGLTQDDFVNELFVSRQTVSNWENSKCFPDVETLILLSNKFGISLDVLLKDDVELVKTIDERVKSGLINKRIVVCLSICMIIMAISFWVIYKSFLVRVYYVSDSVEVQEIMDNMKYVTLEAKKDGSNKKFGSLNFFVPDTLEESKCDYYGDALENEMYYVENNERVVWVNKNNVDNEISRESDFRFKCFGFDYDKLMSKYKLSTEIDLIKYYENHRDESINVFWNKKQMQIDYLARYYVHNLVASSHDDDIMFLVNLDDFVGNLHVNGDCYVILLYRGNEVYALRYRRDRFSLDSVFEMLKTVYLEN